MCSERLRGVSSSFPLVSDLYLLSLLRLDWQGCRLNLGDWLLEYLLGWWHHLLVLGLVLWLLHLSHLCVDLIEVHQLLIRDAIQVLLLYAVHVVVVIVSAHP